MRSQKERVSAAGLPRFTVFLTCPIMKICFLTSCAQQLISQGLGRECPSVSLEEIWKLLETIPWFSWVEKK